MTTQFETPVATAADLLGTIQPAEGGRELKDPATGEVVGRVAEPGAAELDAAVAAARAAQPGWAALGHAGRSELLNRAADAVEANAEALAGLLNQALPADVLAVVPGGREVGEALASHPQIAKVMFTGSTATGKAIIRCPNREARFYSHKRL